MNTLDIVIVNKDSGPLLRRCISSLEASVLSKTVLRCITVVDNDSSDGSACGLRPLLPLTVYPLRENIGFAAACNFAARLGCADYLLFLNPDVSLAPDTLENAVHALAQGGSALLGIRLNDERGAMQPSRMIFPQPCHFVRRALGLHRLFPHFFPDYHIADQQASGQADCVLGAFLLVRRNAFRSVGGFDEAFFLYFEEIDLARRLHADGFRCEYRADLCAVHTGGCGQEAPDPFRIEQSVRSRMLYARRAYTRSRRMALALFTFTLEPLARALYALFCGTSPFAVLRAYAKAGFFPASRQKRSAGDAAMQAP